MRQQAEKSTDNKSASDAKQKLNPRHQAACSLSRIQQEVNYSHLI